MPLVEKQMALEKSLLNFFMQTMQPFELVEQPIFVKVFDLMNVVTAHSRMTIHRCISDLAGE